jgi:hypothetical protein
MRYIELMEFGRRGFPGFNLKLFNRKMYTATAYQIRTVADESVKEFLVDFFVNAFRRDNSSFSEEAFRKACDDPKVTVGSLNLQQRHFYYLAKMVKDIEDVHAREYVARWMGDWIRRTNFEFKMDRWLKECGISEE